MPIESIHPAIVLCTHGELFLSPLSSIEFFMTAYSHHPGPQPNISMTACSRHLGLKPNFFMM